MKYRTVTAPGLVPLFGCALLAASLLFADGVRAGSGDFPHNAYAMTLASRVIDSHGGVVEVTNAASPFYGTRVMIPAGAIAQPTLISINEITSGSGLPGDVLVTDIEPFDLQLALPAKITLRYSPQYLFDNGIGLGDEPQFHVQSLDIKGDGPAATLEPDSSDAGGLAVTITTPRFGAYAPMTFSKSTLNGKYELTDFNYHRGESQGNMPAKGSTLPTLRGLRSILGTVTFDGAGNFSISAAQNKDGSASSLSGSGTYTVSSAGVVSLSNTGLSGMTLSGGTFVNLASTSGDPEAAVLVKKSGTFSKASLSGKYELTDFNYHRGESQANAPAQGNTLPTLRGLRSIRGIVTFDGAGNFSISATQNKDGSATSLSGSGTYTVSSAGAVSLSNTGLSGQVLSGNGVVSLSSTSGDPELAVLVKKSGTFSKASLSGKYELTDFNYHRGESQANAPAKGSTLPTLRGLRSIRGTVTFDGAGNFSISATQNKDGSASSLSGSGTYTVSSAGAVSLSNTGLSGQVLSGGSAAFLSSTSGDPEIAILVK